MPFPAALTDKNLVHNIVYRPNQRCRNTWNRERRITDFDEKHMLAAVDFKGRQLFVQINFVVPVCHQKPFQYFHRLLLQSETFYYNLRAHANVFSIKNRQKTNRFPPVLLIPLPGSTAVFVSIPQPVS